MRAMIKRGVVIEIIMTTESTFRKQLIIAFRLSGISFSKTEMSLLNLFMILPEGVDSKKLSLLLSIAKSMLS